MAKYEIRCGNCARHATKWCSECVQNMSRHHYHFVPKAELVNTLKKEDRKEIEKYVKQDVDMTRAMYRQMAESHYGAYPRSSTCVNPLDIHKVHFDPPLTVVIWKDGTKTFVRANGEAFDPEKGLAMAIVKKALGNKYAYFDKLYDKWIQPYYDKVECDYPKLNLSSLPFSNNTFGEYLDKVLEEMKAKHGISNKSDAE